MEKPGLGSLVVIGAGGHAKAVTDTLLALGADIVGLLDTDVPVGSRICAGATVVGDDSYLDQFESSEFCLAMGIGFMPGSRRRHDRFAQLTGLGWKFPQIVHPSARVGVDCELADGAQVMAGAIIQAAASVGRNSLVNTGAILEHDVRLGENSHVASGATICGESRIGDAVFVGAGATVIQGVRVGTGAVVAAGATVVRDVEEGRRVGGIPAAPI